MAIHKFVNLNFEETKYLADLNGIAHDLKGVISACKLIEAQAPPARPNFEIIELYTAAILVKYASPFSTGVREKIGIEILNKLTSEQLSWHQEFMDWRGKHIAHSVNPFERNQVVGYFVEGREQEGFNQISIQHGHVTGLGAIGVEKISSLARIFLGFIEEEIDRQKKIVLDIANDMGVAQAQKIEDKDPFAGIAGVAGRKRKR